MAIIQIRNAAGAKGVEREEMPKRDLISKRAMRKIVEAKDAQLRECGSKNRSVVAMAQHNEQYFKILLKKQERLTYYVGAVTFLIGGGLGWLIP